MIHPQLEALAKTRILAMGLKIRRYGEGWLVTGPGIELLCAELAQLSDQDLKPYAPRVDTHHNRG